MARVPDPDLRRRWQQLVASHDTSGLTVAAFCHQHDVSTASFYAWRKRLRDAQAEQPSAPAFVSVEVTASAQLPIEIHLPGGVRMDVPVTERRLLIDMVHELAERSEEQRS